MYEGKTELRLIVDTAYLEQLYELTGSNSELHVVGEALGLLKWCATEASRGRPTMSATPDGKALIRLDIPILTAILDRVSREHGGDPSVEAPLESGSTSAPDSADPFRGRRGK